MPNMLLDFSVSDTLCPFMMIGSQNKLNRMNYGPKNGNTSSNSHKHHIVICIKINALLNIQISYFWNEFEFAG